MKPTIETLKVTWKIVRRPYPCCRTPKAYCSYIIENENHKHKRRTPEGSELFKLLATTTVSKSSRYFYSIFVDCTYVGDKLISITNPRKQ